MSIAVTLVGLVLALFWVVPPAYASARPSIKTLSGVGFVRPPAIDFRDTIIHTRLRHLDDYGGTYTAPDGTPVRLFVSASYAADTTANQAFVNFLGSLVHGSELRRLTVYVKTPGEVRVACRGDADACYDPNAESLIVPGEDAPDGTPLEQIVAHEYGHHIANNRSNAPWDANAWGTKRWASYENICLRTANHMVFPGDEGANYSLNPGEAFAETYRVLNANKAGTWGYIGWDEVDQSFYPDATDLQLVNEDVVNPWTGPTRYVWRGRFTKRRQLRTMNLPTYNDGVMAMTLVAPRGSTVGLFDKQNRLVAATRQSTSALLCGDGYSTAVLSGRAGKFTVTIGVP